MVVVPHVNAWTSGDFVENRNLEIRQLKENSKWNEPEKNENDKKKSNDENKKENVNDKKGNNTIESYCVHSSRCILMTIVCQYLVPDIRITIIFNGEGISLLKIIVILMSGTKYWHTIVIK